MKLFDKNFKEIFLFQSLSLLGGILAGTILAFFTDKLLLLPGMLILLPGLLEMRGSISGSMAARITSGLYLKLINPDKPKTRIIFGNVLASFVLVAVVSFALGLIAFSFNYLFFDNYVPKIIAVALLAGVLSNGFEIILTLFLTFYLFKKGHNPDNMMGPFITTTGDVTCILSLLLVMFII